MAAPRVVYQGEPGCYSEEAAVGFFGPEVSSRGLAWFPDVFAALERGEADYAVLPVENSSTGSIRQVYDLLAQYNYYVVGECQVKVEHCLMALPGVALEDIRTVYSHEQGLMQCERYLDAHRGWRRCPPGHRRARPSRWLKAATAPPPPSAPGRPLRSTGCIFWPRGSTIMP